MTQTVQSLWIHLKEMVDELGELATDSSTVVVEDELWAKIEAIQSSIKCIKSNIKKKTEELHLSDQMTHKELDHLKTNKWLDVDEDIWQVPHHEDLANFPDGEELEHCKAEFSNLHTWFMTQCSATWHAYTLSCDAEVKFFALLELHHLHDLVEAWQRHSSAMIGSDGQIGWMNLPEKPPPLCYGRIQILCGPVSPVANSPTGEAVDGVSDAASLDDDENGELEDAPVPQDIAF
ncbi:hypothetical protein BS47DRAFT_1400436 [Hydnum rufescens UP504]|uniref:Uncharacterized protein n=1 Tax=Hydnum rufescens UP504 TaxID=1448309 RepID=A0A9P6DIW6_9AGAM|nr:hypothetical protein BS47DRAFT_1400436 [Hydnum rufescens UP504]